jgi:N2-methylguanosine tRNA methyltransferase (EC 2.1.1.-)
VRILFELSGEHPTLPCAELESVGTVLATAPQVAIAECPTLDAIDRLALTHTVLEYRGQCPANEEDILALVRDNNLAPHNTFRVRVKRVQGASPDLSPLRLERQIGMQIPGRVSLVYPEEEFRLILSGPRAYLGRAIAHIDRGAFLYRNPLRRPFFHPGVMMPRFARALVNLSLIQKGDRLLDPFCGTGGILLEAHLLGADTCGSDADSRMVAGARQNIPHADVLVGDAMRMPLDTGSADAVVSDLPYGQSVGIHARDLHSLYTGALQEIHRVLKAGRRAVLVSHRDIRHLSSPFALLQYHDTGSTRA